MESSVEEQARGARTQSLFRDVNERVREINETFSSIIPQGDWICECADQSCSERIALTTEEYETVRSDPRRFAIAPRDEHLFPRIEDVVERNDRYWVVEKYGVAGDLAAKVDPRAVGLRGARGRARAAIGGPEELRAQ